ncbi:acyl-CoA thioesterase [Endozoicomonas sp. 8E]|uniref:acyl-CoA thioesterase n=1 Tax=Endozoicomonas sp. 8E TaxID=3035692 RepID=UPI00293943B5|nr:hotdog domain-containing protein [Endozoicomonas sp. 8E]WOG28372.1 hotdog domain-containing protein [Endozoicomonas sp. 8E]
MELDNDLAPGPQGELTLKVLADYQSVNTTGDVFGGWVAMQIDQAGAIMARKIATGRVVTVSIGSMSFMRSVKMGDILALFTRVTEVGKTSIRVVVEAWVEDKHGRAKLTETNMVFVAIDTQGRTSRIQSAKSP